MNIILLEKNKHALNLFLQTLFLHISYIHNYCRRHEHFWHLNVRGKVHLFAHIQTRTAHVQHTTMIVHIDSICPTTKTNAALSDSYWIGWRKFTQIRVLYILVACSFNITEKHIVIPHVPLWPKKSCVNMEVSPIWNLGSSWQSKLQLMTKCCGYMDCADN